uniref:Uncharacterized protein n=1 Tax=Fundulus heteroclitus TaxID=8078 RepID=A0A3Q2UN46_FUNHE
LSDFELAQLQEKLRETELVMENIVSSAHHSPDRVTGVTADQEESLLQQLSEITRVMQEGELVEGLLPEKRAQRVWDGEGKREGGGASVHRGRWSVRSGLPRGAPGRSPQGAGAHAEGDVHVGAGESGGARPASGDGSVRQLSQTEEQEKKGQEGHTLTPPSCSETVAWARSTRLTPSTPALIRRPAA